MTCSRYHLSILLVSFSEWAQAELQWCIFIGARQAIKYFKQFFQKSIKATTSAAVYLKNKLFFYQQEEWKLMTRACTYKVNYLLSILRARYTILVIFLYWNVLIFYVRPGTFGLWWSTEIDTKLIFMNIFNPLTHTVLSLLLTINIQTVLGKTAVQYVAFFFFL